MDRFDDDTLFAELRALRPRPRPEFAAALDERAAAGFPRRSAPAAAMPFGLIAARCRAISPRRRLVPVLAVALTALVVATAIVAISRHGPGANPAEHAPLGYGAHLDARNGGGGGHGHRGSPEASGEAASETDVPTVESAAGTAGGGAIETKSSSLAAGRDIERSAYIVLGTRPGEVAAAAAKVYEAVHAANGIVLHSRVQSGRAGATGAYFELQIPSGRLGGALAALSAIAAVRERHDATDDITAPTVGAGEELRDSNAAIEGLLKELGDVETESERESVEARLREERRRHAAIRASLDHLHKRASTSAVTVRIVTGRGAGVTPAPPSSDDWDVGDALHDAGDILTIAAGIVLIGLAVLAPIALIALALWLANRFRVRRLRERTLG